MSEYSKRFYSTKEVSQMLDVPIYTLRFWERMIPMFNPHRTPKGTRRFTPADIDLAKAIRVAVYDKVMKIDGVIEYLNKTYRRQPPRNLRKCKSAEDALMLLDEVKGVLDDSHQIAKIEAVKKWIETPDKPKERKTTRSKKSLQQEN